MGMATGFAGPVFAIANSSAVLQAVLEMIIYSHPLTIFQWLALFIAVGGAIMIALSDKIIRVTNSMCKKKAQAEEDR